MKKYVVYRKEVCKIINDDNGIYNLVPISDESIKYKVPVNSSLLRDLISKKEINMLLKDMPFIDAIDSSNEKKMEEVYKELMKSGTHEDLIKIIKTTYLRNQIRIFNNKKISEIDDEYFKRAEKYLYEEIGIVLNMNADEVRDYIIEKLKKQANV